MSLASLFVIIAMVVLVFVFAVVVPISSGQWNLGGRLVFLIIFSLIAGMALRDIPIVNGLYVGIRNVSTAGANVFVFDNASALTGAIDLATASQAQLAVPGTQVMSSALDGLGNFYFWKDSATQVNIVNAPHTLTGAVTVTPDKVINAVVDRGYGIDVMAFP